MIPSLFPIQSPNTHPLKKYNIFNAVSPCIWGDKILVSWRVSGLAKRSGTNQNDTERREFLPSKNILEIRKFPRSEHFQN
jgi:hypothetical protein